MVLRRWILAAPVVMAVSGCATWSTSDVTAPTRSGSSSGTEGSAAAGSESQPLQQTRTSPNKIIITESDISDRPYRVLGDIDVTVNKTTIFHPDPTRELVAEKLRERAAELGADAVVLVRYGTVGVSLMSWGSLGGKGRAVVFSK